MTPDQEFRRGQVVQAARAVVDLYLFVWQHRDSSIEIPGALTSLIDNEFLRHLGNETQMLSQFNSTHLDPVAIAYAVLFAAGETPAHIKDLS